MGEVNDKYIWYEKMPKTRLYFLKDFLKDSPKIWKDFKKVKPLFLAIKISLYFLWPFVKCCQITTMFFGFIFLCLWFLYILVFGGVIQIPFWFVKQRYKQSLIDFLILSLFRTHFCSIYHIFYIYMKRFFNYESKNSLNLWSRLYNFCLTRIIGFSLWTIYKIDILSHAIYNSFYDVELEKGSHLFFQVLGENLNIMYINNISDISKKVSSLRIISEEKIKFNPFMYIVVRKMYKLTDFMGGKIISNTVLRSSNGKIHATTQEIINDKFSCGSISTHKVLVGQEAIRQKADPTSKDRRDHFRTLNTAYENNMTVKDTTSLIERTGLNLYGDNIHGLTQIFYALDDKKEVFLQTKAGNLILPELFNKKIKDPNLSPRSNLRNDRLDKSFEQSNGYEKRILQLNDCSQKEISFLKTRKENWKNKTLEYDHFQTNDYSDNNYFETVLRNEYKIIKNDKIHTPFTKIKNNINNGSDDES